MRKLSIVGILVLFGTMSALLAPNTRAVTKPVRTPSAVRLASLFTSNMVLQHGRVAPVWGWAKPGTHVTVAFGGQKIHTIAGPHGKWVARLAPLAVSAHPRTLTVVAGAKVIAIQNVLVGDVWLCSGQSNMQYPMAGWFGRKNLAHALAQAIHPNIRLFRVPMVEANFTGKPRRFAPAGIAWQQCTPRNAAPFSAVGYFFGLDLHKELGIPIGLIEADWGGTNIDPWIPAEGFFAVRHLKEDQAWLRSMELRQGDLERSYTKAMALWHRDAQKAMAAGKHVPQPPKRPQDLISAPHAYNYHLLPGSWQPNPHQNPTTLFNGMINPLIPYAIRGAVWYQGENNVNSHDLLYFYHLKALTGAWRKLWGEGQFPFYIVQIAPFNYRQNAAMEPIIWQAEERAARRLPNCAIASTMDIGDIHNIHPPDKATVGQRLANIALAKTYHVKGIVWSGPVFSSAVFSGSTVVLHFTHSAGGLASRNGKPLNWFYLSANNHHWVPAQAKIVGDTVVVQSAGLSDPVAVRFAWNCMAQPNLMNKAGLPALPFQAKKP